MGLKLASFDYLHIRVSATLNFSSDKILDTKPKFRQFFRFFTDFCIEMLDKIFDGQNILSDKILDTKPKYRQFCLTNFCRIRYEGSERPLFNIGGAIIIHPPLVNKCKSIFEYNIF